jgi:hypothetical protein
MISENNGKIIDLLKFWYGKNGNNDIGYLTNNFSSDIEVSSKNVTGVTMWANNHHFHLHT